MNPIEHCNSEIALCFATEGQFAYLATIWHLDWEAEKRMIEHEASA